MEISTRRVIPCEENQTALKCKFFKANKTEAEIEKEFKDIIRNPSLCGQEYPKLAVLIWVLQEPFAGENDLEKIKRMLGGLVDVLDVLGLSKEKIVTKP